MNWIKLEQMLLKAQPERAVAVDPALSHSQLRDEALCLAAGLRARGVQRMAVHLEDAADLAIALLGAWRAGVRVLLPADLQAQTRQRWSAEVDLWLTDQPGDTQPGDLRLAPWSLSSWTSTNAG
jgi:non-ribosomal peptide synthetase component F